MHRPESEGAVRDILKGGSRFLRRCREGRRSKEEAPLRLRSTPTVSRIVFQAWVPIQMQTPGGAFALWPRALDEIDKLLLVRLN